jgi:hypothetical protein
MAPAEADAQGCCETLLEVEPAGELQDACVAVGSYFTEGSAAT